MADDGKTGSGGAFANRKVLIAIALAVAALIIGILLMRGQGQDATNMNGPDTAATQAAGMNGAPPTAGSPAAGMGSTPGYGQPNATPTENVERPPNEAPPVNVTAAPSQ